MITLICSLIALVMGAGIGFVAAKPLLVRRVMKAPNYEVRFRQNGMEYVTRLLGVPTSRDQEKSAYPTDRYPTDRGGVR